MSANPSVASPQRETVQKTAAHTPGPWCFTIFDKWVRTEFQQPIAMVEEAYDNVDRANARLISASPDLLDAAKCAANVLFLLNEEVERLGFRAGNVADKLRAAIAKAGGGQ